MQLEKSSTVRILKKEDTATSENAENQEAMKETVAASEEEQKRGGHYYGNGA